jgi:3-phosphoinositide dependent protein kinase-1
VGTPLYVAPEMLKDNISGPHSDIWALGCILYQFLVGDVPFRAQSDFQTFDLIVNKNFYIPNVTSFLNSLASPS